jgi:hypothetical protein
MGLTNGLQLPYGIQPVNPVPVDSWSGPYYAPTEFSGLTAANSAIPIGARFPSMEVRLIIDGKSSKYWYYSGVTDSDLILFSGGGSGDINITNPINNGVLISDGTPSGIAATNILKVTPEGVIQFTTTLLTGLTSNTTIVSFDKTIGTAYYFDYWVTEQGTSASRSGTVIAVWKNTTVEFTDTSTSDIFGSTLGISFSVVINNPNIELTAEIISGTWDIKIGTRAI